jgi:hypothetical protein
MGLFGRRTAGLVMAFAGPAVLAACAQGHQPVPQGHQLASGTAQVSAVSGGTAPSPSKPIALPAMAHIQHAFLTAIATGRLVLSGGCFYLADLYDARRISLVWPYQYSARSSPPGVYDANDRLVARPGEKVFFGGGYVVLAHVAPGTIMNTQCLTGAKGAWFISGGVEHL